MQIKRQAIALRLEAVDLQPGTVPMGRQLQILYLVGAVQLHTTHLDVAQLQADRQLQIRQLQRRVVGTSLTRSELQGQLGGMQAIQAQGHAQQTGGRPGEIQRLH